MGKAGKRRVSFLAAALMLFSLSGTIPAGTVMAAAAKEPDGRIAINEANFPDPMFRAVLSGAKYDKNGDGYFDQQEILELRNIECQNSGISSLKGIEYFTELRGLYCMDNSIRTMDLSKNKELTGVWCSGNLFTSLDFTPNPELMWVYCFDCNITSLNVSNNPKMAYIECNDNPLGELDVTHNPELEHLICNCCGLSELDVTKNPKLSHLEVFNNSLMPEDDPLRNHLKELDVTHNPKMKRLNIWDIHGLGSIDVSKCTGLQYYNCANNGVTSIDVSHNPELTKLSCAYNPELGTLDLSNNPKLAYLDCAICGLGELDLSKNPKLYFLQAFTNGFKTLDIGYNPLLLKTYNDGVKRAEYDVCEGHSWTIDLGIDDSTSGDSIYFLCFDDAVSLKTAPKYTAPAKADVDIPNGASADDLMTREVAVQTLYNMAGKPDDGVARSRFTDVKSGEWYDAAVRWGEKYNICIGTPDVASDTFGIGEWVTRQDLAVMLMRYAEYKGYNRSIDFGRSDDFIDYYDIDYYAWEAITWAATWNIMIGKGAPGAPKEERRIEPHTAATRQDFREMIERMLEKNEVYPAVAPEIPANPAGSTIASRLGDLDRDGKVDNWDLALLQQHVSGWKVKIAEAAADVTGDNKIDNEDIARLQQFLSGWNVKLGKKAA